MPTFNLKLSDNTAKTLDLALPTITQPSFVPKFPGQTKPGTIRWGAGIGGNADPVARHESVAGVAMGIRRTFWDLGKISSAVTTAKNDIAAGRLPWLSFKVGAWVDYNAGKSDAVVAGLLNQLKALPGPVWLTIHHEPEGGASSPGIDDPAGAAGWRDVQKRTRSLLTSSQAKNIAFAPVLMTWTFDTRSGRNPNDWWVDEIWDFVGLDMYQSSETGGAPQTTTMWKNAAAYYKAKNMEINIGEWGNRGTDAIAAAEMQSWYDYMISINSSGVCYFDSGLNSPSGSWELVGEPLTKFRQLMKVPTSVRL